MLESLSGEKKRKKPLMKGTGCTTTSQMKKESVAYRPDDMTVKQKSR